MKQLYGRRLRFPNGVIHYVTGSDYMSTNDPVGVLPLCERQSMRYSNLERSSIPDNITEDPVTCLGCLAEDPPK